MVVCPVCEHQQAAGDECQVCGKKLSGPGVVPLPAEALPGLELTALGGVEAPPAPPIPGLEPTHHQPAAGGAAATLDLEPTLAPPVEVQPQALPDLEPTEAEPIPGDGPTARPATLVCRYCRTENPPTEASCVRCGMRLPIWDGPAVPLGEGAPALVRCPACGTLNAGDLCTGCGVLVRRR
ncbi:MAG TPA: hypothetical protein VFR85_13800 [Anaeromyxobacteraceae bacterium]|nr:hypothetical protein [Anaeromyxobacteraceae bacterium]